MPTFSSITSVVVLLTTAGRTVSSQQADTLKATQQVGIALARLIGGQWVRVRARGGLFEGWFVRSSPSFVTLRTAGAELVDVSPPTIDSLWMRVGNHAGRGALIGGLLGGVTLALVGAHEANDPNGPFEPGHVGEVTVAAFLIGGAGGGLIGALIGRSAQKWQLAAP